MDIKEEFHTTQASALALISKAKTEARALSAEEKAEVQNKFSRLKEIAELLGEESKLASLALATDEGVKAVATQSFNQSKNKESNKMEINKVLEGLKAFGRGQSYEQFALTSAGNSGVLMPKSVPGLVRIRQTGNAFRRGFAALNQPVFTSSATDNVTLPVLDDTSNVANNNQEGATSGVNLDPTYSASLSLNLVEYHSKAAWVSKKVVNAQDFDVTEYLIPLCLNRIERQEEIDWTAAVIAIGSGVVGKTAASATVITLPELIDWDESFSAAYDDTSRFIMLSKGAALAIRKLADSTNVPFVEFNNGSLKSLFNKPVIINPSLGAMTTGQTIAMQVSVDGSIIRDSAANEILRYESNPSYPGQVGFEAIGYSAFANTNSSIRTLKLA